METLSTRAQRLATQTSTKRLFYLCGLLGLTSLIGVCVVILPWNILYTQGQWVAFAFIAIIGFCWISSLAAISRLEKDLPGTVKRMAYMLSFVTLAQIAIGIFLEYQLATRKPEQIRYCLSQDETYTSGFCEHRLESIIIAFPIIVFLLPILSIPLLYLLFRQSSLLSTSHLYSNLVDDPTDLPPNWNVQPETFAPDSSEDEEGLEYRDDERLGSGGSGQDKGKGKGRDSWYEMGKREKGSSTTGENGKRWSQFRRQRDRKGKGKA
ncbi:hypothetical protein JCM16303_002615 [Sporobolomyces ruberrimus]